MNIEIVQGDCMDVMAGMAEKSVQCCITSPPYWGLRDYGVEGQFGLEKTLEEYISKMVDVFREVRRVLRDDGTLWLNLGDTYWGGKGQSGQKDGNYQANRQDKSLNKPYHQIGGAKQTRPQDGKHDVIKPKDLVGIPWMVAFALRADGWYLRQDIIWHKPSPMPESVTDRCTKAHEYIFLLSKNKKYYFDNEAIKEPLIYPNETRRPLGSKGAWQMDGREQQENGGGTPYDGYPSHRNKRSVWTVTTKPFRGAHFATFPEKLIEPCVKAGCPEGDIIIDPFAGAGTVGVVCKKLGRNHIGIELNPDYCEIARKRIAAELTKAIGPTAEGVIRKLRRVPPKK